MNCAATAYIALGSNLGDRRGYLCRARELLAETPGVLVSASSSLYETTPVGGPAGQEPYLNAVLRLETTLPPQSLLATCLAIEALLGRQRTIPWGPRSIDLDLLLYGAARIDEPDLTVPHPRLHLRTFVLVPLCELAPDLFHPTLGCRLADFPAAAPSGGAILHRTESWS
jgi:2-amino-4-hydroxy-6-hydroxymethyldihydropteridine diphosphokinase